MRSGFVLILAGVTVFSGCGTPRGGPAVTATVSETSPQQTTGNSTETAIGPSTTTVDPPENASPENTIAFSELTVDDVS